MTVVTGAFSKIREQEMKTAMLASVDLIRCENYFIAGAGCRSSLEALVATMCEGGWIPQGGICVGGRNMNDQFYRAMVRFGVKK